MRRFKIGIDIGEPEGDCTCIVVYKRNVFGIFKIVRSFTTKTTCRSYMLDGYQIGWPLRKKVAMERFERMKKRLRGIED